MGISGLQRQKGGHERARNNAPLWQPSGDATMTDEESSALIGAKY